MRKCKIKILRVITRLNVGGPAIHVSLLTGAMSEGAFETKLVAGNVSGHEGDMEYLARAYGVSPVYVKEMTREISPLKDLAALFKIFKIIRGYRPDIVHTHTAKAGALGRVAAIVAGVPVIVHTFHGNVFDGYFSGIKARVFIWVERALALFTKAVVVVSENQRKDIVEKYGITSYAKCRPIKLGFDLKAFLESGPNADMRAMFGLSPDDVLVGIAGRLTAIKNHRMFIDAACRVIEQCPAEYSGRVKFIIIGDGELRSEISEYAASKKSIAGSVFFTGWQKDMSRVYGSLDIVALTSINEGTPVSIIEAMASGRPVVSTDVGGIRDIPGLRELDCLVAPGDVEGMAGRIMKLATSRAVREETGARGRALVRGVYSGERLVADITALYGELCGML